MVQPNPLNVGWTGIGVVAGVGAVVLIMQWPHGMKGEVHWRSELLQRLQEVRTICKTRNQLMDITTYRGMEMTFWLPETEAVLAQVDAR